jgi:nicotinate-nucleotide adenylyltransferase
VRIGVFGGSFDPVHLGHLLVAECAREQAQLDRVLFVPTAIQPHKQDRPPAAAELDRGGVSYTVDTLEQLAAAHPGSRLCLILGPDALASLPTWKAPERIVDRAELVAVERDSLDDLGSQACRTALLPLLGVDRLERLLATRVRLPAIGIRASALRAAIAAGGSIRYRTPRAVEEYIRHHGLYR